MIELILLIVIVGVVLYFVNQHLPMAPAFKTMVNILAVIILLLFVLQYFGLTDWNLHDRYHHRR